jgi:hypothetical protein
MKKLLFAIALVAFVAGAAFTSTDKKTAGSAPKKTEKKCEKTDACCKKGDKAQCCKEKATNEKTQE